MHLGKLGGKLAQICIQNALEVHEMKALIAQCVQVNEKNYLNEGLIKTNKCHLPKVFNFNKTFFFFILPGEVKCGFEHVKLIHITENIATGQDVFP